MTEQDDGLTVIMRRALLAIIRGPEQLHLRRLSGAMSEVLRDPDIALDRRSRSLVISVASLLTLLAVIHPNADAVVQFEGGNSLESFLGTMISVLEDADVDVDVRKQIILRLWRSVGALRADQAALTFVTRLVVLWQHLEKPISSGGQSGVATESPRTSAEVVSLVEPLAVGCLLYPSGESLSQPPSEEPLLAAHQRPTSRLFDPRATLIYLSKFYATLKLFHVGITEPISAFNESQLIQEFGANFSFNIRIWRNVASLSRSQRVRDIVLPVLSIIARMVAAAEGHASPIPFMDLRCVSREAPVAWPFSVGELEIVEINWEKLVVFSSSQAPVNLICTVRPVGGGAELEHERGLLLKEDEAISNDLLFQEAYAILREDWCRTESINPDKHFPLYGVILLGPNLGLVEMIEGVIPVSELSEECALEIRNDKMAHLNLCVSAAGQTIMTYLLGAGDRHSSNMLINRQGILHHIDFGWMFGQEPKRLGHRLVRLNPKLVFAMGRDDGFALFIWLIVLLLQRTIVAADSLFALLLTTAVSAELGKTGEVMKNAKSDCERRCLFVNLWWHWMEESQADVDEVLTWEEGNTNIPVLQQLSLGELTYVHGNWDVIEDNSVHADVSGSKETSEIDKNKTEECVSFVLLRVQGRFQCDKLHTKNLQGYIRGLRFPELNPKAFIQEVIRPAIDDFWGNALDSWQNMSVNFK